MCRWFYKALHEVEGGVVCEVWARKYNYMSIVLKFSLTLGWVFLLVRYTLFCKENTRRGFGEKKKIASRESLKIIILIAGHYLRREMCFF